MDNNVKDKLFSVTAISVGAAGFISAIVTMFVNTAESVSVKWIIFLCWVFITAFVVLMKIIIEQQKSNKPKPIPSQEKPIRIDLDRDIIIIRKNNKFLNGIVVCCYCINDEIETLAYIAFVAHVQENFLQLKVLADCCTETERNLISTRGVDCMVVKPHLIHNGFSNLGGLISG
ncbi:hypothetical protein [Pectobacterium polaris]|uniref:Uncharacterized protein n=1 Tax=Pectobacterium polaris TaxID=2042057 RepID=A0AAW5GL84_9GAMM|nr:hypothetical protein [Pectobacterium polaris]MCL6353651.1 hypothetical protein [Pectobacterium polaris]MCL6371052.1 hypothetical protein [Pectobacterium polaris]